MTYKYENRLVAFIDILGFAGKIAKSRLHSAALKQLCEAIYSINDFIKEAKENIDLPDTSNVTQFSDSVVISLKMEDSYSMLSIFRLLKKIQVNLLRDKILMRGGIVKGELIHRDDLLLGPGLVNAYYLESKCAQYPRIVIDPKVMWQFARSNGKKKESRLKDYNYNQTFIADVDGTSYIDYFNNVDDYLNEGGTVQNYFQSLCELIKDHIDSDDISTRIKYLWMREKLKNCEYFPKYKNDYRQIVTNRNRRSKSTP